MVVAKARHQKTLMNTAWHFGGGYAAL